ncbi:MAG: endonuclease V [Myxococcales bacterium]|nr:endonuclease V [Myxococcales bacterium]
MRPAAPPPLAGAIVATDVHYRIDAEGRARAAAVVFDRWEEPRPRRELVALHGANADYEPGAFFRRELPCLLAVLDPLLTEEAIAAVIVDGYVDLGDRPGLGHHLFDALRGAGWRGAVIGVAKTPFRGARPVEVLRGGSLRPLHVTALGLDPALAAAGVAAMAGEHRLPILLGWVDHLARGLRAPGDP